MAKQVFVTLLIVFFCACAKGNKFVTNAPNINARNEFPMPNGTTLSTSNLSTIKSHDERKDTGLQQHQEDSGRFDTVKEQLCALSIKRDDMFGIITSPNYPEPYPNNISCIWKIRAPSKHLTYISFANFHLEQGVKLASNCPFDFLYVFEEFTVRQSSSFNHPRELLYRRSMGTFCGDKIPESIQSRRPGSSIILYFNSDKSRTGRGFSLSFRFLKKTENTYTTTTDMWHEGGESDMSSMEEEFLKIFSCVVFVFVFFTVLLGTLYKCWKSTSDQLDAEGHAHHSCCCGAIRLDLVAGGSRNQGSRLNQCDSSPRLPTPPPEYGEVVKTEEDWNRVIQQLGEASATALRQRIATEELQVTYDLGNNERTDFTTNSSAITSSFSDSASVATSLADSENRVHSGRGFVDQRTAASPLSPVASVIAVSEQEAEDLTDHLVA